MRAMVRIACALVIFSVSLSATSQESALPTIINEIGQLEDRRDPKCYATAQRLEDFIYGTPLSFEARLIKIDLQKRLVSEIWAGASDRAVARGSQRVGTEDAEPLATRVLPWAISPTGDVVVTTRQGEKLTIVEDDLRQYGSVAYGLRTILTVQQEALLAPAENLVPLDAEGVTLIKDLLDIYTLATLQLADLQSRLLDAPEVSASVLKDAWNSLGNVDREEPPPLPDQDSVATGHQSDFTTLRAIIDQKLASYTAYNDISLPVFIRNLQVYFARHRWPSGEEETEFTNYFNQSMVFFVSDLMSGAKAVAQERTHTMIRVDDVHTFMNVFLPHEVNAYEDVIFFPRFPASERIVIESYDLDAFRDSGLHWQYLQWAIEDPSFSGTLEPDPFAAELLAEATAQFGVLVLRVAGMVAREEGSDRLAVRHLEIGLKQIQAQLDRHAGLQSSEASPPSSVPSAPEAVSSAEGAFFSDLTHEAGIVFRTPYRGLAQSAAP